MRAKKVSRVVGFVFVVAAIGGIGATAWGSESETSHVPPVVTPTSAVPSSGTHTPLKIQDQQDSKTIRTLDSGWE